MDARSYIQALPNVSRETFDRLEAYVAHLQKWNPHINLIAKRATREEIWERHILDSLQLAEHIPSAHRILDMGSGGGLPGIVLACCGYDTTLVESDVRKSVFLQEALRICNIRHARVLASRIEDIQQDTYDTITARALAPLNNLLGYAQPHLGITSQCLFQKGERYRMEMDEARGCWRFDATELPSRTSSHSVILRITHLERAA